MPAKVVANGALASVAPLAGEVTAVDLLPGEQLVPSRFVSSAAAAKLTAPPGAQQVTVALDAVRALGGAMLGRPSPQKPGEREAALEAGLDLDRVLTERDLVASEDVFFAATGITDGELMSGVHYRAGGAATHSLVMRSRSGTIRSIRSEHQLWKLRAYSSVDFG